MKVIKKYGRLIGIIFLIIDIFIIYYRFDILQELINGRPAYEIELHGLLLPILVLVIGIYLIIKKRKQYDSKNSNN